MGSHLILINQFNIFFDQYFGRFGKNYYPYSPLLYLTQTWIYSEQLYFKEFGMYSKVEPFSTTKLSAIYLFSSVVKISCFVLGSYESMGSE